jgi:hypothetical protein
MNNWVPHKTGRIPQFFVVTYQKLALKTRYPTYVIMALKMFPWLYRATTKVGSPKHPRRFAVTLAPS